MLKKCCDLPGQISYNESVKTKSDILKELKSLKLELHEKYHVEKLGLFGSYATDCADEESDLDIIIEFLKEQPEIYRIKNEIRTLLQKRFGLKVDLAREKFLKPYYKEEILKQVIYV